MNIQPLEDRLVVEAMDENTTTASGIVIPDTVSKEKPQKGKVVAVGPGRTTTTGTKINMTVKEGDIVVFQKYSPAEIKIDGKELLVISESDVLGIIK